MKLNIKKLQIGGVIYNPTGLSGDPTGKAAKSSSASTTADKDPIDAYMKEVTSNLVGKGLINEVNMFSNEYKKDLQAYEALPDTIKDSYQGKLMRRKLQGDIGQLNEMVQNQASWNKSYEAMKTNGTQSTAATIGNSFVVKTTEGKITTLSFDKYKKEDEGSIYKVLTTSELLDERNRNPYLAFDSEAIDIAKELKSPEAYSKIIEEFASKASGDTSSQMVAEGFLSANEAKAMKLLSGNIESGVYKTAKEVINSTNKEQLDLSLKAAMRFIGPQGMTSLTAKFLREGVDSKELQPKIEEYLVSLTYPKLQTKQTERDRISFDAGATKATGSGAGGAEADKVANMGAYELAFAGRANKDDFMNISKGLSIHAPMFALPDTAIAKNNKKVLLGESDLNKIADLNKATTLDGLPLDINQAVMKNAYVTELPVKEINGKFILDVEGSKLVAQYDAAVKNAGLNKPVVNLTEAEKVKLNTLKNTYKYYQWNTTLKRMVVGEAVSYDPVSWFDSTSDRSDSPYYEKVTDEEKRLLRSVTVDGQGARNYLDNPMKKHLVIIPAKDISSFRFADGESLRVNRNDVMMDQYTGYSASSLYGERSIRELVDEKATQYSYEDL